MKRWKVTIEYAKGAAFSAEVDAQYKLNAEIKAASMADACGFSGRIVEYKTIEIK